MENKNQSKMEYRHLGNSGLKVSVLSWGNWINSNQGESEITNETVRLCYEAGINFFDTAEIYGAGKAEEALGVALKKLNARREDLVISTKIFRCGNGQNDNFLSRKHIMEGLNNSLKRLQLDYVDVFFCHRPDMETPIEETVRAMNFAIEEGKTFYWGTSEWTAVQIAEANAVCDRLGLIKPIVEQCQYNMMARKNMEADYAHLFKTTKMGTTIWSPLLSGILTGKYIDEIPKDSRFDIFSNEAGGHLRQYTENREAWNAKLLKLRGIAERLGFSLATLALAWCIRNPDVSTCILGTSRPQQVTENLKALELLPLLTNDIEIEIESILGNAPLGDLNYSTWETEPNRRELVLGYRKK